MTKKEHPWTRPDPVRINAAHYPDNVPATTDLAPKHDCILCMWPHEATGLVTVTGEDAHPVHPLRCGSLRIAVLRCLPRRARFLIWWTGGKRCWGRFWISRGVEHGFWVDREILRYGALRWTGVWRLGMGATPNFWWFAKFSQMKYDILHADCQCWKRLYIIAVFCCCHLLCYCYRQQMLKYLNLCFKHSNISNLFLRVWFCPNGYLYVLYTPHNGWYFV